MGAGHSHLSTEDGAEPSSSVLTPGTRATRRRAVWILSAIIVPITLLTMVGMALLWPTGQHENVNVVSPYTAASGVTFDTGAVKDVRRGSCSGQSPDPSAGSPGETGSRGASDEPGTGADAGTGSGSESGSGSGAGTEADASTGTGTGTGPGTGPGTGTGTEDPGNLGQNSGPNQCFWAKVQPAAGGTTVQVVFNPEVSASAEVKQGDRIRYLNLSQVQGAGNGQGPSYVFVDFQRGAPIALLAILYAAIVILVARWRGLRALLGLGVAYLVLAFFLLPGLQEGRPPLLLALVASAAILIAVLYFAHGFSTRTSTALLGTLFGLGITAALAVWATDAASLVGIGSHEASTLINAGGISISGVILCGLIIAGLGALNDVTITQASAVWELYELSPQSSATRLFRSAMRIGRDHIASTVYTIAFAYAGAALPVLMIVMLYERPLVDTLTSAELAEEVIRTLIGSIGLVLAIPLTTLIAVLVVKASGLGRRGALLQEAVTLQGSQLGPDGAPSQRTVRDPETGVEAEVSESANRRGRRRAL